MLSVLCQISAQFGTCTAVGLNGTLVEAKMFTFTLDCKHFIFNKFPSYTHDGANAKFSTTDKQQYISKRNYEITVVILKMRLYFQIRTTKSLEFVISFAKNILGIRE
jgi:hypothetical protein